MLRAVETFELQEAFFEEFQKSAGPAEFAQHRARPFQLPSSSADGNLSATTRAGRG
jgi:hypothetical protein